MSKVRTNQSRQNIRKAMAARHKPKSDADYLAILKSRCAITEAGCWEWQRFRHTKGYGAMCYRGKSTRTHRIAYTCTQGAIPPGKMVLHRCDNPPCCNPDHLYLGDGFDNMRDCSAKGRINYQKITHCKNGHPLAETAKFRGVKNPRVCSVCARVRQRVAAGWLRELAESMPPTPKGRRPVGANFAKLRKPRASAERGAEQR